MKDINIFINEAKYPYEGIPNVITLGDGCYKGAILNHCFLYEGKKYYCESGLRNMFPIECEVIVENNKMHFGFMDKCQKKELLKLFNYKNY